MKYSTVLLDIDDTVLDFGNAEKTALGRALRRHGIEADDALSHEYHEINDALWKEYERGGIEKEQIKTRRFERLYACCGFKGSPDEMAGFYIEELSRTENILDGAREFLCCLNRYFGVYAVTNGIEQIQKGRFAAADIGGFFREVFISEQVGYGKPDKRYFDYVLSRVGERDSSRIIVVGDSPTSDITGAQNAGLDCCWYTPQGGEYPLSPRPTYTARSYAQILAILGVSDK